MHKEKWDAFVNSERDSNFFLRDYMEYYADRFVDASLIALKKITLRLWKVRVMQHIWIFETGF